MKHIYLFNFQCTFKLNSPTADVLLFKFTNIAKYCNYGQQTFVQYYNGQFNPSNYYQLSTVSTGYRLMRLGANMKGTDIGNSSVQIVCTLVYLY